MPLLILLILFSPFLCRKCPSDWISVEFEKKDPSEFNITIHDYEVKLSLRITATDEKDLRVCGRIYTDELYPYDIPPFEFFFREEGRRANGFFESSYPVKTDPINAGKSFSFETIIHSTESDHFKNLPRVVSVVSRNTSIFFVEDYFYVSSAFFSDYFISKSRRILRETSPFEKICIPIFSVSGHGKDCFASHMRSITTPLSRMLHPSGAGKGVEQTTNTTHPQFIVDDVVQIIQTVGFQQNFDDKSESDGELSEVGCSKIKEFVNDTIQGRISKDLNCLNTFVSLYIISVEEATNFALQTHFCTVKYITGILNSVYKHEISTYTLFNTKGREYDPLELEKIKSSLYFNVPDQNVFFIDLNVDSVERDFEKDVVLMRLLEDLLDQHLVNFNLRKKIALDDLRNNKWEELTDYELMIMNLSFLQYINKVLWQNLFTVTGFKEIWNFLLLFVIPHILRRYMFEFIRQFCPIGFDVLYGLFGKSSIWTAELLSVILGYGGLGAFSYFIYMRCFAGVCGCGKKKKREKNDEEGDQSSFLSRYKKIFGEGEKVR